MHVLDRDDRSVTIDLWSKQSPMLSFISQSFIRSLCQVIHFSYVSGDLDLSDEISYFISKSRQQRTGWNLICKCWLVFVHVIVIISSLRDIKCRLSKLFLLLRSNCLSLKKRHFLKCSFTPAIKSRSQSKTDNLIY